MKKYRGLLTLLAVILTCGCGVSTPQGGTETEGALSTETTVSMYDLRVAMEAADDTLPAMLNASSAESKAKTNFAYISDMDYEKIEEYFVSYAEDGGKADEIAVIVVKNRENVKEAEESLRKHKTDRYKLLEQYEPSQTKRIEDGMVFSSDRYAVLIICDNASAVKRAFQQMTDGI